MYRNQYIFGLPVEIWGSRRRIQGSPSTANFEPWKGMKWSWTLFSYLGYNGIVVLFDKRKYFFQFLLNIVSSVEVFEKTKILWNICGRSKK